MFLRITFRFSWLLLTSRFQSSREVTLSVLRKHLLVILQLPESSLCRNPSHLLSRFNLSSLELTDLCFESPPLCLRVTVVMLLWGMSPWDQSATGGVIVQLLPCYCLKAIVCHVPSLQVTGERGGAEVMEGDTHWSVWMTFSGFTCALMSMPALLLLVHWGVMVLGQDLWARNKPGSI